MTIHGYESIIIIQPDMTRKETDAMIKSLSTFIDRISYKKVKMEDWGVKKLAYPIGKKKTGHYLLFNFSASEGAVSEILEPKLHADPQVMKHVTVRKDESEDWGIEDIDKEEETAYKVKLATTEVNLPEEPESEQDTPKPYKPVDVFDLIFGIEKEE